MCFRQAANTTNAVEKENQRFKQEYCTLTGSTAQRGRLSFALGNACGLGCATFCTVVHPRAHWVLRSLAVDVHVRLSPSVFDVIIVFP